MQIGNGADTKEEVELHAPIVFTDGGQLHLDGGELDGPQVYFRNVLTNTGTSRIDASIVRFDDGGTNTINGTLQLHGGTQHIVQAGASFSGNGRLQPTLNAVLYLYTGADLNTVSLEPDGQVKLAFEDIAFAAVGGFAPSPNGRLWMDVAGFDAGISADQLFVTGDATLAGRLILETPDDFTMTFGETTLLMPVSGTSAGTFNQIDGVALDAERGLAVTYEPDGVHVTAAARGDSNFDRDIDLPDFYVIKNAFDPNADNLTWIDGDHNGSGAVDAADFAAYASNFNPLGYTGLGPDPTVWPQSPTASILDLAPGEAGLMVDTVSGAVALVGNAAEMDGLQIVSYALSLTGNSPTFSGPVAAMQPFAASRAYAGGGDPYAEHNLTGGTFIGLLYDYANDARDLSFVYGPQATLGPIVYYEKCLGDMDGDGDCDFDDISIFVDAIGTAPEDWPFNPLEGIGPYGNGDFDNDGDVDFDDITPFVNQIGQPCS
jgi:hypothetical protein